MDKSRTGKPAVRGSLSGIEMQNFAVMACCVWACCGMIAAAKSKTFYNRTGIPQRTYIYPKKRQWI